MHKQYMMPLMCAISLSINTPVLSSKSEALGYIALGALVAGVGVYFGPKIMGVNSEILGIDKAISSTISAQERMQKNIALYNSQLAKKMHEELAKEQGHDIAHDVALIKLRRYLTQDNICKKTDCELKNLGLSHVARRMCAQDRGNLREVEASLAQEEKERTETDQAETK